MCIASIAALFGVGCHLAMVGWHNYRLFHVSSGGSEHEVHLDRQGSFTNLADPPGRSMFRPGGVIQIFLIGDAPEGSILGAGIGTMTVCDRIGQVVLKEDVDNFGEGYLSSRGRFIAPIREFDTTNGGPYEIRFEITKPFTSLTGIRQVLSVRHFVSGGEAWLHVAQFTSSGLLLGTWFFLIYRRRAADKSAMRSGVG